MARPSGSPTASSRSTRRGAWRSPGQPASRSRPRATPTLVIDLRPLVVMPGLVDTHVHLPQVPAAGLGAGMDLLAWLERYVFPLEHDFDVPTAEVLAPQVYRAMAAAGTTTFAGYGAIWADSLDACFRAAEAHGIRATLGKVMMDRLSYDERLAPAQRLETSLRQSAELCERWHGAADGRLRYAFTPRFAVCCSADLLRESAALANHYGSTWQTHLSEDQPRDRHGRRALPRSPRLPRRLRPRRWPGSPGPPGARHPPLRARGRAARGDGPGRRPLPRQQHVHPQRRHAPRAVPGRRHPRRPRHGRGRGAGALGRHPDARGLLPAEQPPHARP